ncbi:MAG: leucine-rich repeat domain-containing protein, partial [Eubacterium sp.]
MKKAISLLLSFVMIMSIMTCVDLSILAQSSDFDYEVLENGTAQITQYNGDDDEVTIPSSIDGYEVTSIGFWAFEDSSIESVIIPEGVTSIEYGAFSYCENLKSVTLPSSLESMDQEAFYGCYALTDFIVAEENSNFCVVDGVIFNSDKTVLIKYPQGSENTTYIIPDSVIEIGSYAFSQCKNLTSITIPDSVISIGDYAFHDCTSLTSVTIPNSVKSIGDYAFFYCTSLMNVTIGDSVTSISDWAFYYCTSLTNITIPDSVTSIGYCAFYYCTSLTDIIVDSANANYSSQDGVLFDKNKTTLIQYPIGNERISYTIPNSVTSIGDYALCCTGLTSITIPENVTYIGNWAFADCTSLTSITIPENVTYIGDWAFADCTSLTSICIENKECEIYDDYDTICENAVIFGYKDSTAQAYAENYDRSFVAIDDADCSNGKHAYVSEDNVIETKYTCVLCGYYYCEAKVLSAIHAGETVTVDIENPGESKYFVFTPEESGVYTYWSEGSYDTYGYLYDDNLQELTHDDDSAYNYGNFSITYNFEQGKKYILQCRHYSSGTTGSFDILLAKGRHNFYPGDVATSGDYKYELLENNSVEIIDYLGNAENVTIPASLDDYNVESVGRRAFAFCTSLQKVTIPDNITAMGYWAFSNCDSLNEVNIGKNVTTLSYGIFYNCESLSEAAVPKNIESIQGRAFDGCTSLTSITIENKDCSICDDELTISETATIYGYKNSTAQTYAETYGRTFVALDAEHTHTYNSGVVTKAPTCTATGIKTYTCTVCGATKTEIIAKTAHTPVTDKAVAATCTKTGLTQGSHCSVCGTVITAQKTVAKTAHTYKTTTTKATTSKNGSVVTKCSVCGAVKSKSTIYYPKTITLSATSYTYDGKTKKPTVT